MARRGERPSRKENRGGEVHFSRIVKGDSAEEVLKFLEYDLDGLRSNFREMAGRALERGLLTAEDVDGMINEYDQSLEGYTYLGS